LTVFRACRAFTSGCKPPARSAGRSHHVAVGFGGTMSPWGSGNHVAVGFGGPDMIPFRLRPTVGYSWDIVWCGTGREQFDAMLARLPVPIVKCPALAARMFEHFKAEPGDCVDFPSLMQMMSTIFRGTLCSVGAQRRTGAVSFCIRFTRRSLALAPSGLHLPPFSLS
jgi:hypothetical protein